MTTTPNSHEGDDLLERLVAVDSDPIGCGLANNSYRNPDGPAAAAEITRLRQREAELSAMVEKLRKDMRERGVLLRGAQRILSREILRGGEHNVAALWSGHVDTALQQTEPQP